AADRVALRCNLVEVSDDGVMVDFAGGRPSQDLAVDAIELLQRELGGAATFHAGLGYRHIVTVPAEWADATCTPPHDIIGRRAVAPDGPAAGRLNALMSASRPVLRK